MLGQNDRLVRAFIRDLAGMSSSLVSERVELERALNSVARAVGTVKTFVHDNRQALVTDVEKLTRVVKNINSERDSLDTALQVAPLALGNLAVAFNNETGTIGSRIGVNGTFGDADGLLCSIVQQSDLPRASKNLACTLFEQLLEPVEGAGPTAKTQVGGQPTARAAPGRPGVPDRAPAVRRRRQRVVRLAGRGWLVNRRLSRLAGVFVLGASVLLSGCEFEGAYDLPLPGSPVDEDDSYVVTAEFADVLNVVPRSVVMVDDVTVGEVTEVDRVGWHARITMRVRNGTVLPDNAIADIRQSSLLGEKYVALEDPTDEAPRGQLGDGDNIAALGHRPEPRGRGGARRALVPAQRRRRRPARHHHRRAEQGDGRPHRAGSATCWARWRA